MESQPRLSYASLAPSRATVLGAVWCCDSSCLTACVLGVFTAVAVGSQSPGNLLSQKRLGVTNDLWKHWGNFFCLCVCHSCLHSPPCLVCSTRVCSLFSFILWPLTLVFVPSLLCPFSLISLFPALVAFALIFCFLGKGAGWGRFEKRCVWWWVASDLRPFVQSLCRGTPELKSA